MKYFLYNSLIRR